MKIPFLNKKDIDIEGSINAPEEFNVRDIIAPPYIGITQDKIQIEKKFKKSFFIFSYPRYLDTGARSAGAARQPAAAGAPHPPPPRATQASPQPPGAGPRPGPLPATAAFASSSSQLTPLSVLRHE